MKYFALKAIRMSSPSYFASSASWASPRSRVDTVRSNESDPMSRRIGVSSPSPAITRTRFTASSSSDRPITSLFGYDDGIRSL